MTNRDDRVALLRQPERHCSPQATQPAGDDRNSLFHANLRLLCQPTARENDVCSGTVTCVFCGLAEEKIIAQNRLAYAVRDNAPVTPLHTLILPKRHAPGYFDLSPKEKRAIDELIDEVRLAILADDPDVAGFNIGVNIGKIAGQTIFHCHVHLIPRRPGDAVYPEGGVHAAIRRVLGTSA
jgi:diadenosine tetraphosphate (Ap4A) HIT family hydrolase